VDVLHLYETRYPAAGRKCDLITEMLNRASGNTPHASLPQTSLKRRIPDEDDPPIANLPATTAVQQLEDLELSIQQTDHLFSLPLSTEELGLLPVYESFDFQFNFDLHQTPPSPPSSNSSSGPFSTLNGAYVNGSEQFGYIPPGDEPLQFNAYSWEDWSSFVGHEPSR